MAPKLLRVETDSNEVREGDPYLLYLEKKKIKEEADIQKNLMFEAPLDYSFKKLHSLEDDFTAKPREGRLGRIPKRSTNNTYLTKGLWLDNNFLVSTSGLDLFVHNCLEYPSKLAWLDLSFNNIKEIHPDILQFQNLIILYLHGNAIENFDTIVKLRELPNLKRLSLHRNPISDLPMYRECMIQLIPKLFNLDFSPVVKREKNCVLSISMKKKYNLLDYI